MENNQISAVGHQMTLDEWMEAKEDIRRRLNEAAGNFVGIGFRLKQIRDSGMFDGAADIFEFAEKEYGLSKSVTSRFIAINSKYSEGGNSMLLKDEYKKFGSSKLAEMLSLPDNELSLITEDTTIKQIRELKEFNKQNATFIVQESAFAENEEPANGEKSFENTPRTEEESGFEGSQSVATSQQNDYSKYTPFEQCIIDFFKDRKDILNGVDDIIQREIDESKDHTADIVELINPAGTVTHKKGRIFMLLHDLNTGVKYKDITKPEPFDLTWRDFIDTLDGIYDFAKDDETDAYSRFYGEEPGQQAEKPVATSQQTEDKVEGEIIDDGNEQGDKGSKEAAEGTDKAVPEISEKDAVAGAEAETDSSGLDEEIRRVNDELHNLGDFLMKIDIGKLNADLMNILCVKIERTLETLREYCDKKESLES